MNNKDKFPNVNIEDGVPVLSGSEIIKEVTSKKRLVRLSKVRTLFFVQRWTTKDIAEKLQCSERLIYRDLTIIRRNTKPAAKMDIALNSDIETFFWEIEQSYKERIKQLWQNHNSLDDPIKKTKVLAELREHEAQHVSLLQDLGFVPRVADKKGETTKEKVVYVSRLNEVPTAVQKPTEEKNKLTEQKEVGNV